MVWKLKNPITLRGAEGSHSRYAASSSSASSIAQKVGPPTTVSSGCARNVNSVTTPKLPPPPRIAQKRSGFSSALAVTCVPSASTSFAESRLSIVSPWRRVR